MVEEIGGVWGRFDFVELAIDGVLDAVGLVKGSPANARGALSFEMRFSNVE